MFSLSFLSLVFCRCFSLTSLKYGFFFFLTHRSTFFSVCILECLVFITWGEFSAIIFMNIALFLFSVFTPSRTLIGCLLALVQSSRAPRYTCFHEYFVLCSLFCTLDSLFRSVFLFFLFWKSSVSPCILAWSFSIVYCFLVMFFISLYL